MKAGRVARCDRCIRQLREAKVSGTKRKRGLNSSFGSKKKRRDYEDSTDDEGYDIAVAGVMKVRWFSAPYCISYANDPTTA